ncbi:MAG TPA: heme-binding protein [Steroidobacteraceae bacterium]
MQARTVIFSIVAALALVSAQAQAPPDLSHPGNANGPPPGPLPGMPGGPPPGTPRPPDVVARSVPIDVAIDLARAIVLACKGFHVGVDVLDAAGTPKLYYVADDTGGAHAYTAYRKANTALKFNMPSGEVAAAIKSDPALAARYAADSGNYVTWAGGVLIVAGHELLGAVGVSGAEPSAKDEECARAGLQKVQTQLK